MQTWQMRHQLHSPLVPGKPFVCSIQQQQVMTELVMCSHWAVAAVTGVYVSFYLQWVVSLEIDVCSESLVVACQDSVYCLDTQVDTHGLLMADQGYTNHRGYSNLPVNTVGPFLIEGVRTRVG